LGTDLFDLAGRTALVTGGVRGIGLACATALLDQGAKVIVTSRSTSADAPVMTSLAGHGHVALITGDLSTAEGTEELAQTVGRETETLNVLVNNAGTAWAAPFESYPDRAWSKVLRLNITAPFQLVQKLLPLLERAGRPGDPSRIVNIGSLDGHSVGPFENYAYSGGKAALHHLTRVLAVQLGSRHISVNCIAPGPIRTDMTEGLLRDHRAALIDSNPLGRLGTPDDVAHMVVFLASRASAYVNGAVIPIDGGYSCNPWVFI